MLGSPGARTCYACVCVDLTELWVTNGNINNHRGVNSDTPPYLGSWIRAGLRQSTSENCNPSGQSEDNTGHTHTHTHTHHSLFRPAFPEPRGNVNAACVAGEIGDTQDP